VLILFSPWFPESPYFLLKAGKREQAGKSLRRIHGSQDDGLLDAEMHRIQENVDVSEVTLTEARLKGSLLQQCFQGTNTKRSLIAILCSAAQQLIGAAFVPSYITYFLELIGWLTSCLVPTSSRNANKTRIRRA
jgi:hypothetical protein